MCAADTTAAVERYCTVIAQEAFSSSPMRRMPSIESVAATAVAVRVAVCQTFQKLLTAREGGIFGNDEVPREGGVKGVLKTRLGRRRSMTRPEQTRNVPSDERNSCFPWTTALSVVWLLPNYGIQ